MSAANMIKAKPTKTVVMFVRYVKNCLRRNELAHLNHPAGDNAASRKMVILK